MKKKIILLFLFALIYQANFAQQIWLFQAKKDTDPYKAISGNRSYSAIINTSFDKNQLIPKTKDFFMEEGLADSAKLATVIYDENLSEYKVRFGFKHGQYKAKGMMGAAFIGPPVILYFDAIFSFNNEGQIQVTFTNFNSTVYVAVDNAKNLNSYKDDGKQNLPADQVIMDEATTILATQTAVGKALLFANGGLNSLERNSRGEFRKNLNEQFEMYNNALKKGSVELIDKSNISEYTVKGNKYWPQQVDKFKTDNLVFSVDNYRWENYFVLNFNYFFKEINNIVSGQIDGIALDGTILYELVEGKLLPIDPKERKTWEKQGTTF